MRDLYKRLGLAVGAPIGAIRNSLLHAGDAEDKADAQAILLDAERRAAYDERVHLMRRVAEVRDRVGIGSTANWSREKYADFHVDKDRASQWRNETARRLTAFSGRHVPPSPVQASKDGAEIPWWPIILIGSVLFFMCKGSGGGEPSAPPLGTYAPPRIRKPITQPAVRPEPVPARALPPTRIMHGGRAANGGPLKVVTRFGGSHYYLKVVDERDGRLVALAFVRAGESVEMLLPPGDYELKYAYGADWYGPQHLFGSETRYARADEVFEIRRDRRGTTGWTVELFARVGGNLETDPISASEF